MLRSSCQHGGSEQSLTMPCAHMDVQCRVIRYADRTTNTCSGEPILSFQLPTTESALGRGASRNGMAASFLSWRS
jgi:hypothetical protein